MKKNYNLSIIILIILTLILSIIIITIGILKCEKLFSIIEVVLFLFTVSAAIWAILLSNKTAEIQNDIMKQEWLPYLSYEKMYGKMIKSVIGIVPEFYMVLKNNGRCIVQYEIKKFDVKLVNHNVEATSINKSSENSNISGLTLKHNQHTILPRSDSKENKIKGVAGINSEFSQVCGAYQFLLEKGLNIISENTNFHFQIDFIVEYGKKGDDINQYALNYLINIYMEFENGKIIERILDADIVGYK